jgi:hypothetical protein
MPYKEIKMLQQKTQLKEKTLFFYKCFTSSYFQLFPERRKTKRKVAAVFVSCWQKMNQG